MTHAFSDIGIVAKNNDASVQHTLDQLVAYLLDHGVRVHADASGCTANPQVAHCPRETLGERCDLVVVVGGDGTLLDAGRLVAGHGTPLLGVNLGRLGFLVDVLPADMLATLDDVFAGRYIQEPRLLLSAHIVRANGRADGEKFYSLNECVIRNGEFARVLDFETYMNDDFISHHRADGIVVATPTGSTAYALSGGGPVVHPGLAALSLVPICPHTLSDRPLIVDANHRIEVQISPSHDGTALFTSDGQVTQPLAPGDRVLIERAGHDLVLIHPPGYDYFNILRNKLHWGRGQATPVPPAT